jgi:adenosylhomocysteine nucleosidase
MPKSLAVSNMASVLIVAPQIEEARALLLGFREMGFLSEPLQVGRLPCTSVPLLDMLVAVGGNGKAQFAVQTQHLIDHCPTADILICVGAAGRLRGDLSVGDVVVATATIEHDYKERFIQEPLPCHDGDAELLRQFARVVGSQELPFRVRFGAIASGDEDIVDADRAAEVLAATQALCVAWEGSGGARAAGFSGIAFLEVRAISDLADTVAAKSFHDNVENVVRNIAPLLAAWHFGPPAAA